MQTDTITAAEVIALPEFDLTDHLSVVAVQNDWGVAQRDGPRGTLFVVSNPQLALDGCLALLETAKHHRSSLILVPELALPQVAIQPVLDALWALGHDAVLFAGVEGMHPDDYQALCERFEQDPDIGSGTYVNAALVAWRTAGQRKARLRAKRVGGRDENMGPVNMAKGKGPFVLLRLGKNEVTVLPLICAELVWENLRKVVGDEVHDDHVDVVTVLQLNKDINHAGHAFYHAYQQAGKTARTRFLIANHAYGKSSSGRSQVILPPGDATVPPFNHTRNELWLQGATGFLGFRIPDSTGCCWSSRVKLPGQAHSALADPPCSADVVLSLCSPTSVGVGGLAAGLMRTAARLRLDALIGPDDKRPIDGPAKHVVDSVDPENPRFVLKPLDRERAESALYGMRCDETLSWTTVETAVIELVEAMSLLASTGSAVHVADDVRGNCFVNERVVAVLFAPSTDSALKARYGPTAGIALGLPDGIVLVCNKAGSISPGAKRLGDLFRSDTVSSPSPDIVDAPIRPRESAVELRKWQIPFCSLKELIPTLDADSATADRALAFHLPGVFP